MKESLAQLIAMVGFGNRFLLKNKLPWRFFKKNEAFKHTQKINFKDSDGQDFDSLKKWFVHLKKQNCQRLSLIFYTSSEDDFKQAYYVGGGGIWKILAHFEDQTEVYEANWKPLKKSEQGQPLSWQVNYQSVAVKKEQLQSQDLQQIQMHMLKVLSDLQKFLVDRRKVLSSRWCMYALRVLVQRASLDKKEITTFLPQDIYKESALKIMTAIASAWLFSGPLVWDTVKFKGEDQTRYENLLKKLYDVYVQGIQAAVNEF